MRHVDAEPLRTHPPRGRLAWRLLFGIDGLVALLLLGFFMAGTVDGTVSNSNIGIWTMMLAIAAGVLGGAIALDRAGRRGWSTLLLSLMAVPGLLAVFLMLLVLLLNPRWN